MGPRIVRLLVWLCLGLVGGVGQAAAERRVALVVGNDAYQELPALQKAVADATDFAAVLRDKGFDKVILKHDVSRLDMDLALGEFLDSIAPGDTAVFFYAGHGWSDGNQNFLVATDVPEVASAGSLRRISVPLQNGANGIIDEMARRGATLKVAIVDACRDNPFRTADATRSIGLDRGLARVDPPQGTFVVFSAGAGQTALDRLSDSDEARNSVFTRTFLPYIRDDVWLLDAVKATQETVYEEAGKATPAHRQEPAYYDQVRGNACLSESCRSLAALSAPPPGPGAPDSVATAFVERPTSDEDAKLLAAIKDSTNPAEYRAFLQAFPDSALVPVARIRLAATEPGYWASLGATPGKPALEAYLGYFPDGPHAADARQRLAALEAPPAAPEPAAAAQPVPAAEAPAPEATADEPPPLAGAELYVALQKALKSAGCYSGGIDGDWGPKSRAALAALVEHEDMDGPAEPTADMLARIEALDSPACPRATPAAPARRAATPPTTRRRTTTTTTTPPARRRAAAPAPAPAKPRRSGQIIVDNIQDCEPGKYRWVQFNNIQIPVACK